MQKKTRLKVIENKYNGTRQWKKDPSLSAEDIEIANKAFEMLAERCNPSFREFIWDKKQPKNKIQLI